MNSDEISGQFRFPLPPKYTRERLLGTGGMKVILTAEDSETGREVAIAFAKDRSESGRSRFIREARLTAMLEHPNIVPVHEIGRAPDHTPFFTMKIVRGLTLSNILSRLKDHDPEILSRYPLPVRLEIFLRICNAISFAHSRNIVHLDLKPENIQVGDFGEVLVLDWGLARNISGIKQVSTAGGTVPEKEQENTKTIDGVIKGTPEFMAPEQARGENSSRGKHTDIYALGAILYAILTGSPPVRGRNSREIIKNVAMGNIVPFNDLKDCPGVIPQQLQFVAYKAMEKTASNRYRSVRDIQKDVEAYMNGFPTQAEEAGILTRLMLWFARWRTRLFLTAAVFFIFFLISFFVIAQIYYKRVEIQYLQIAEKARSHAELQKKLLEKKIMKESSRKWNIVSRANFCRGVEAWSTWKFNSPVLWIREQTKGLPLSVPQKLILTPRDPLQCANQKISISLRFSDTEKPGIIRIRPDTDSVQVPGFELRTGKLPCIRISGSRSGYPGIRPFVFIPGHLYRVVAEIITAGNNESVLTLFIDGRKFISVRDTWPPGPSSTRQPEISFENVSIRLAEVTVSTLGFPMKPDILELAGQMLNNGKTAAAEQLFLEAEAAAATPERLSKAGYGLIQARRIRENERKLNVWRTLLQKKWPRTKTKLTVSNTGFHLRISGGGNVDLRVLSGIPVTALYLEDCKPEHLSILRELPLQHLAMIRTGLSSINDLKGLSLRSFRSEDNPVSDLNGLQGMPLEKLSVTGANLEKLPVLTGLPLKTVNVENNRISDIRPLIQPALIELNISNNRIMDLSPLKGIELQKLNCSSNNIRSMEEINFESIAELNAAGNKISGLPSLSRAKNLRSLDISMNSITSLEPVSGLPKLENLFASQNMISFLPEKWELPALTILNLRGNRLSALPEKMLLPNLICLNAADNHLESLKSLSGLFQLRLVNCSGNKLVSLAELNPLSLDSLLAAGMNIQDYGKFLKHPPRLSLIPDDGTLSLQMLEFMIEETGKHPSARQLHQDLKLLRSFKRGDYQALRKRTVCINGKHYTFIPVLLTVEQIAAAKELKAALPSFTKNHALFDFQSHLQAPAWICLNGKICVLPTAPFHSRPPVKHFPAGLKQQLILCWD